MITQRVKLDANNQQGPTIYARMGEKDLRQIVFILTRKDDESGEDVAVDIPSGAVGQLRILKPTNNFVITNLLKTTLESGSAIFTATLPEQAVTVGGLCYYDVRIEETNSKFIFSATGHMIVDDNVISSGVLEDVSEVNGLVFPDDFLTTEDAGAVIDDTAISQESTWSSYKINEEINNAGAVEQRILYTASNMNELEINVDMLSFDNYVIYTNDTIVGNQIPQGTVFPKLVIQKAITENTNIFFSGFSGTYATYKATANKLIYQNGGNKIVMIVGIKYGGD